MSIRDALSPEHSNTLDDLPRDVIVPPPPAGHEMPAPRDARAAHVHARRRFVRHRPTSVPRNERHVAPVVYAHEVIAVTGKRAVLPGNAAGLQFLQEEGQLCIL